MLDVAGDILGQIRRAKTEAKTSQRTPVARARVHCDPPTRAIFTAVRSDLTEAGSVQEWILIEEPADTPVLVEVELAPST
jgi:valyl-tRNA synthetase